MSVLDFFRLDGKVVIVTGASSGLGVAFAQGSPKPARTWCSGHGGWKMAGTAALVEQAGHRSYLRKTDVADPEQCQQLVDAAMAEFGRVDILINNAGVGTAVPATRETPPEEFRSVIDVNLNGSYWMAQACARVMKPGSAIVNIASVLGLTTGGLPQAAYSASKAGVIGLTRDLAQQWSGRKGIRVNAIAPGSSPAK